MKANLSQYLQNLNESTVDLTDMSNIETFLRQSEIEYIDGKEKDIDYDFTDEMVFDAIMDDDYWNYTKAEYSKVIVYFITFGCSDFYKLMYNRTTGKLTKAFEYFSDEAEGFDTTEVSDNINKVIRDLLKSVK